jgi:hypothetical protein
VIPDEVIEEAAKAGFTAVRVEMGYWATWEELPQEGRDMYIRMAKAALLAALPEILAEERAAAWGLGMWTMYNTTSSEWPAIPEQNPFRGEPKQHTSHYVVDENGITPPLGSVASEEWRTL